LLIFDEFFVIPGIDNKRHNRNIWNSFGIYLV
jgi:hypothetical protein